MTHERARFEAELQEVQDEIRYYPRPITGRDVQFNHLLERSDELRRALREFEHGAGPAQDA